MATIQEALTLALRHLHEGRFAEVKSICASILKVDRAEPNALHLWGLAARQEGKLDEAVQALGAAAAAAPHFIPARINLGNALRAAGRGPEALRSYRLAVAAAPEMATTWHTLGGYLTQTGGSGGRDDALRALRRAVTIDPKAADALHDLGLALRYADRPQDGADALRAAVRAKPEHAFAHANLGTVLVELGEHAEALDCLKRAVALAPGIAEIHYNDGNARHACGDLDKALSAFRRSARLGLGMARTRIGMALHDLGRDGDAEETLRQNIVKGDDVQASMEWLTQVFISSGRTGQGRALFTELAHTPARTHLGECLTALADFDLQDGQIDRAASLLASVQGDGGRLFTIRSVTALRRTLDRLGTAIERPANSDPNRPTVTSSTLASHGRFAHNVLEYVLVRLYAEKHGYVLETPEWVGGYVFEIDDPPPTRKHRPFYYPRQFLNRHIDGSATTPPISGVDFRSPLFLLNHAEEHRDRVRSWLRPRQIWAPFLDPAMERLRSLGDTVVAIHIRRGDFVGFNYPITETGWYVRWLREIWPTLTRPVLYVASDDLAAVRADFAEFAPVVRADVAPDWPQLDFLQDFHVLTRADVVGISVASGFSLLAAQLNETARLVVAPDLAAGRVQPFFPWTPAQRVDG